MLHSSQYETRIYTQANDLHQVRDFWESLQWHPYADFDYYLAELRIDRQIVCPCVIALLQEGAPKTLLIGKIVDRPLSIKFGYKTILQVNLRTLVAHSRGVLGDAAPAQSERLVRALLDMLAQGEIELVHIMGLPKSTPLCQLAVSLPPVAMRDHFPATGTRWQLRLHKTYADFLNEHPSLKRNLRYYANRLQREFGDVMRVRCFASRDDLDDMMRDLEAVASKTWQRGLGAGFVNNTETQQMFDFFIAHGWLRAYVSYLKGYPAAFNYGIRYGNIFVDEGTGFDPAYARFYVGKTLFMRLIEDMHADNEVDYIDFGPGNDQDKRLLCNQSQAESSVLVFAPTSRCLKVNLARSLIVLAHHQAKRILKHFGTEGALKKRWRVHGAT